MVEYPTDSAGNRHPAGRYCITRIPLALGLAGGALWLALEPDQTILPLVLWLLIVLWAVLGIWDIANTAPDWERGLGFCGWSALLGLSVSAGSQFAAGYTALASVFLLFLFFRLPQIFNGPQAADADGDESNGFSRWNMAIQLIVMASSLWLASGTPPDWAADVIRGVFWTVAAFLIFTGLLMSFTFAIMAWMKNARNTETHQLAREQKPEATLRREWTTGERLTIWSSRVVSLTTAGALWVAGQDWLAACYLLSVLLLIAVRSEFRRVKFGENARVDFFTRLIRFLVWWPVVAVVVIVIAIVLMPILAIVGIFDWFSNRRKAKGREREERVRKARVKRATASYRLREEFGKPDGFVYFLYSEPHQQDHFLGQGGFLAGMEGCVEARDWRAQVIPARSKAGWTKFQQAPEGALLHVNGIGNMQKDLPFIAIVPPKGRVQVFKISEPYRARRRDKGTALAEAEAEISAAVEAVFGEGK